MVIEVNDAAVTSKSADVALYLDLDGVVHHEAVYIHPKAGIYMSPKEAPGRVLFEWLPILIDLLEPYPDLKLVLSSTWCIRPGYRKTLDRLPLTLRERFVGGTFHKRIHGSDPGLTQAFQSMPRGEQVCADVGRRMPRKWLALDDDVAGWPERALVNLVACDGSTGISDLRVQEALKLKLQDLHIPTASNYSLQPIPAIKPTE
ncbi:HAD domain-containing protein [Hydrogenophaga sp. 2FB]|uniref:HAD domain-containing protein n=1 Tax=Hydrogenophaga sp. 2FB TaxID=2502187 RepID=UPI0010F45FBE|nr:HAD domain-containing protein [Hydrogenophaga sp. 2FB]